MFQIGAVLGPFSPFISASHLLNHKKKKTQTTMHPNGDMYLFSPVLFLSVSSTELVETAACCMEGSLVLCHMQRRRSPVPVCHIFLSSLLNMWTLKVTCKSPIRIMHEDFAHFCQHTAVYFFSSCSGLKKKKPLLVDKLLWVFFLL